MMELHESSRLLDMMAIQDLVVRERHWRDRECWDQLRACWTDGARVVTTWFSGDIDAYVADSRQPPFDPAAVTKHRLSPPVVTVHGDRALAETSVLLEMRLSSDGVPFDAEVSVRLLSRVVRTGTGWKLAGMEAIYEKDVFRPVYPADTLRITADDTTAYRPSYQFLAYGAGGRLPDDIPGDDRPDLVGSVYESAERWLKVVEHVQ